MPSQDSIVNKSPDLPNAQTAQKNVHSETFSLSPSTLIELYEIDTNDLVEEGVDIAGWGSSGYSGYTGFSGVPDTGEASDGIFRFHNNIKLIDTDIIFNGNTYIAAPILAEGFALTGKGAQPRPKISLIVNDESIPILSVLKRLVFGLSNDLVGAKVTRLTTLLKFLDAANTFDPGFNFSSTPNTRSVITEEIYYIDRKSSETSNSIEYELNTILDVEGVKLPYRIVTESNCVFDYRGEGCMYEDKSLAQANGVEWADSIPDGISPVPVANDKDELITDILDGTPLGGGSEFDATLLGSYSVGSYVYITKGGINYYFVCKAAPPVVGPPNQKYWIPDQCSKKVSGCRLRWKFLDNHDGSLPFGGFPGVNKVS